MKAEKSDPAESVIDVFKHLRKIEELPARIYVHVDVPVSRRKRYHMVTGTKPEPFFISRTFGPVLEWLDANGITRYTLVHEDGSTFAATLGRASPRE